MFINRLLNFLNGLSSVDTGVECVLNEVAYSSLAQMIKSLYGEHALQVFNQHSVEKDGKYTFPCEGLPDAFRLCLQGKG